MSKATCKVEGCERPTQRRDLCNRHYRQQLHSERGECSVEDCHTKWQSSGLCTKHYSRMRSHGTTDDPEPKPLLGACSVEDCDGAVRGRRWCGKHLQRWYRWGTTDDPVPSETKICRECQKALPRKNFRTAIPVCEICYPQYMLRKYGPCSVEESRTASVPSVVSLKPMRPASG